MVNSHIQEIQTAILTNAIAWCLYGTDDAEQIEVTQEDADKCRAIAERCMADLNENHQARLAQSNMVQHARRELELLGEEPDVIDWYCDTVLAFASYGHSGGSASVAIPILEKLLMWQHLNDLTDLAHEWIDQTSANGGVPLWQSARNPAAMSDNGGRSYWLVDDPDKRKRPTKRMYIPPQKEGDA